MALPSLLQACDWLMGEDGVFNVELPQRIRILLLSRVGVRNSDDRQTNSVQVSKVEFVLEMRLNSNTYCV